MKPGKAPGPDRYILLYYKTFSEKLPPTFLAAFNSIQDGQMMPAETLMAHITVIPKEEKDPSQCSSYHPISLLSVDLKILTKILANRLLTYIPSLIHPGQVGFTPNREGRENTLKCHILRATLQHIGLGSGMQNWIASLYSCPKARVKINDT